MAWLKPDKLTEFNTSAREALTSDNFDKFIEIFVDESGDPDFTDQEITLLKGAITEPPLKFSTGYPLNKNEPIRTCTIYIVEGGWQQLQQDFIGSGRWDGKAATHIVVTGRSVGENLNMAEPSLLLKMVTSLLLAGINYFTANHLINPVITETIYGADEANSNDKKFAMRSLQMTYEAHRQTPITRQGIVTHG